MISFFQNLSRRVFCGILISSLFLLTFSSLGYALVQMDSDLKPDNLPTFELAESQEGRSEKLNAVQSVAVFAGSLVNRALIFLSSIGIFLLIIAGANYSFSFGNPDRAEKGKRGLLWTLVGLLLVLFSYAIVQGVLQLILMLA